MKQEKESSKQKVIVNVAALGAVGLGAYVAYRLFGGKSINFGFRNILTQANMKSDGWLAYGIKNADEVKTFVEDQGGTLFDSPNETGYLVTHTKHGFPIISRMNVTDYIYTTDEVKSASLLRRLVSGSTKNTNYLHVCVFTLPDVVEPDSEFWLMFFSSEKKFWKDANFLTNQGHSWTASPDWKQRIRNRDQYNIVTNNVIQILESADTDFLTRWNSASQVKSAYEKAKELVKKEYERQYPGRSETEVNNHVTEIVNPYDVDYYMLVDKSRQSTYGQSLAELSKKGLLGSTEDVFGQW